MAHSFDAETEALRRELIGLPQAELYALAQQEGVRVAGRSGTEIIESLLRMDCEEDAAGMQGTSMLLPSHQQGLHNTENTLCCCYLPTSQPPSQSTPMERW